MTIFYIFITLNILNFKQLLTIGKRGLDFA